MYSGCKTNLHISLKLSQVMEEIGLTENIKKRRQVWLVNETICTLSSKLRGDNYTPYLFGSQTEGTTTVGLHSDQDELVCRNDITVVQSLDDVEQGNIFLMVINDCTTKGYSFIKPFTNAQKLLELGKDTKGEFLSNETKQYLKGEVNGPALTTWYSGNSNDTVEAYYCPSWPKSASGWLDRQGIGRWPTLEMKRDCISKGFFLVPVGSKASLNPDIEWRISTSLAERCLMYSLNITQIRCYVLLKMIAKSHFEIGGENKISSFMCKTTLFHCIENSEPRLWTDDNLYICLFVCLLQLRFFVRSQKCPHFIITENNLMVGQFTPEEKHQLLDRIDELVITYGLGLFCIEIDDLGKRLQIKMNIIPQERGHDLLSQEYYDVTALFQQNLKHFLILEAALKNISECASSTVLQSHIQQVIKMSEDGSKLERSACNLLLPDLFSVLGSMMASLDIDRSGSVSQKALAYFEQASDSICKRLKLASIYYCSGHLEDTENIFMYIQRISDINGMINIPCCCYVDQYNTKTSSEASDAKHDILSLKREGKLSELFKYFASCIWFSWSQRYCIPPELQYEMFRYSQYEMFRFSVDDVFDKHLYDIAYQKLVLIDYLPFFYFLEYKTYCRLRKNEEKQQALSKLAKITTEGRWLGHQETAFNILGQCYEQEHGIEDALQCYMASLQLKEWNNVVRWHICKLLARIVRTRFGSTTVIYRRTITK